jgi:hypothetical protein
MWNMKIHVLSHSKDFNAIGIDVSIVATKKSEQKQQRGI